MLGHTKLSMPKTKGATIIFGDFDKDHIIYDNNCRRLIMITIKRIEQNSVRVVHKNKK